MSDTTTTTGSQPLRLPEVLDSAQQEALTAIARGLSGLTAMAQAVEASRSGARLPADAAWLTAGALDALLTGGRAYLDAVTARQGWRPGSLDPAGPMQSLLLGIQGQGPERLDDFCTLELPWALATTLAQVPPASAARLLRLLSDDLQDKVVILLGVMTQAEAESRTASPDVAALLELLRALPPAAAERITASIEQLVPALSEALYQALCTGMDVLSLDDARLQRVIPRIPHREWGLLLKYATAPVRERVFANVTRRVARMLQDEIEMTRPGGLAALVAVQHRLQAAIAAADA
jgi:hypothetical protein